MDSEVLEIIDFTKVKKKKKETKIQKKPESKSEKTEDIRKINLEKKKTIKEEKPEELPQQIKEEYTYEELLKRVYDLIKNHNPEFTSERANLKIPVPQITSVGKTRSSWLNFESFVESLNRPRDHLSNYVKGEIGCEATIGGEKQLFLKAKVSKNQIESILRKYIQDYVKCPNCKSFKTILKKDQSTRLLQICCESCKTEKTIQNLKSSVKAGKR